MNITLWKLIEFGIEMFCGGFLFGMITIGIIIRKLDKEDEEERKKYGL
jgi:hypothetical protein